MGFLNITSGFTFNNVSLKQGGKLLILLGFISLVSVSCGKKGPLYLSPKDTEVINKKSDATKEPANQAVKDAGDTPAESTK